MTMPFAPQRTLYVGDQPVSAHTYNAVQSARTLVSEAHDAGYHLPLHRIVGALSRTARLDAEDSAIALSVILLAHEHALTQQKPTTHQTQNTATGQGG
jgi:hypothetical protein